MCKPTTLLHATLYVLFFLSVLCYTTQPPSVTCPCARAYLWRWTIDAVAVVFVRAFVTTIIHEHSAACGGYQQSRHKLRLYAKTVTIEITLAFTSDWRTTNANNITLNPLLALTHLAPPSAPRYPGPRVLWLAIIGPPGRAYRPLVLYHLSLYSFSYLTTTLFYT